MKFRFSIAALLTVTLFFASLAALYGTVERKEEEATQMKQNLLKQYETKEFLAHVAHQGERTIYARPGSILHLETKDIEVKLVTIRDNKLTFQYRHDHMKPNAWTTKTVELEVQEQSRRQFGYAWFYSKWGYGCGVFILRNNGDTIEYSPDVKFVGH